MNFAQAHKILTTITNGEFTDTSLHDVGVYLHATKGGATLDGKFDADDLEAIALWMRHPKEVAAAQPQPTNARIEALEAKCADYEAALNSIASWNHGPIVGNFFDKPSAANEAREALAKHGGAA